MAPLQRWIRRGRGAVTTPRQYPPDFDGPTVALIERVRSYTMTSPERLWALIHAVDHLVRHEIRGDYVECGVWRGGSSMAAALALIARQDTARTLHLYDTFEGMTAPTAYDRSLGGDSAETLLASEARSPDSPTWCVADEADVRRNLASTGYPGSRIRFVRGPVEQTLPDPALGPIALLRLDTDWYASTRHELDHLYPLLVPGGVLIIDDYGHWEGARRAVDEYLSRHQLPLFLQRIDYTGRMAIKPAV
ncbi:MAG: class I SAM-dependent methyltransferase [Deltaproteobacteria bacterium]|nr:class I SAM-dependent methyltransferase [Deltaproteobacteria bacterium]